MSFNVAIDGPAGAGKSTVAKSVAALKNFIYVDTGAMYRAMALYFLRQGIDKTDENAINAVLDKVEITIRYEDGAQQVILNGENVSGLIRTEEVGNMASATSVYKKVREKLVELQKDLAKKADVIMDGREIEKDIIERDYRDMHRENSPLKQADDAVLLDSSDMTLKEVVDTITAMIDKKQGA